MISVVGIGNGASAIAVKFNDYPQYNVYVLNDKIKKSAGRKRKLKSFETPEEYENHIPNLAKYFAKIDDHVQVFVVGSSFSSSYALGIIEQIKDKKIDLFYIKPDVTLLTGIPLLVENAVFGILQQYARSGAFNTITVISNKNLEIAIGNVPVKKYYDHLNSSIVSTIHYLNYFDHNEPEIGVMAKPAETHRIRSVGLIDPHKVEEKWFFDLDMERQVCYYFCINKERLETDGSLHKRLVDILKEKPRNAFRKVSYAIYETDHGKDFGFVVAHTNAIQQQNTLDKID
jgi:hypothetical protein|tara:strand:+ start:5792 stop:6652 length:861 start_codon:yes stop_codon:yes gene_type:complete